jgi:predicted MFS family arabinose efflux permease
VAVAAAAAGVPRTERRAWPRGIVGGDVSHRARVPGGGGTRSMTTTTSGAASGAVAADAVGRPSTFAAFRIPQYARLWVSGAMFNLARWGISFLAAYMANELSHSPRLVQLTGVAMWTPMLLGGVAGGVISDRSNRRRTMLLQYAVMIPLVVVLATLYGTDHLRLWMIYPFLVVAGLGFVVDMTTRRSVLYDIVGAGRLDNAMALESLSMAGGLAFGALAGGTVVDAVGLTQAISLVAILLVGSLALFASIDVPARTTPPGSARGMFREGFGLLGTHKGLVSILGVTSCVNFFYFTYTPLVQVIGSDLGARPALIGLLASMTGFGMMIASLVTARFRPERRGLVYTLGAFFSLLLLLPFAAANTYLLAVVALLGAAVGGGFFGALQGVLVMTVVPAHVRGRALGLLSMAIGVLPLGMLLLGEVAEWIGTRQAVAASSITGVLALVLWVWRRPEVTRITNG